MRELDYEKRVTYSPEVCECLVRMILTSENEHSSRWAAIQSITSKIGFTPETLEAWTKQSEVDVVIEPGISADMAARLKELERENQDFKQAKEILRKAAAF